MQEFQLAIEHLFFSFPPWPLLWVLIGTVLGVVVGAVPGLTGAMLITLTLPITYGMVAQDAMILLVSMYVGSISGGLITATLLRMPGTPASIITTLDGYPLAKTGRPGRALGLGILASFAGGCISCIFLLTLSYPISEVSTKLGPFDYFSLVLVALVLISSVSGDSLVRGLFAGMLGILCQMPGESPATGEIRWTMGIDELNGGFSLLPVLMGMFAISQVIHEVGQSQRKAESIDVGDDSMRLSRKDVKQHGGNMVRSSLIGTWVGILPGIGANIGSVMAYSAARGVSKEPEKFGKGSEEGIVASEAANNATVGGALIPLVAMGIPGSVIDAILLGALVLHGLQPGVRLFSDQPDVVYAIIVTMFVANAVMFGFMLCSTRWIARLARVPKYALMPIVLVFCVIGSYALNNRLFDVWVMMLFGLVGFVMERCKMPLAPFVIGFVLAPIAEKQIGEALQASAGSYLPLITSPVSAIFLVVAVVAFFLPFIRRRKITPLPDIECVDDEQD